MYDRSVVGGLGAMCGMAASESIPRVFLHNELSAITPVVSGGRIPEANTTLLYM